MRRRRWRTAVLWIGCTLCVLMATAFVVSARWSVFVEIPRGVFVGVFSGGIECAAQPILPVPRIWRHGHGLRRALVPLRWSNGFLLPLVYPFAAVAVPTLLFWRFVPKFPSGHCQRCGYNLTGLTEARCPECGQAF